VDYVRRYLEARYGREMVRRGGLRVQTTLDPQAQADAEAAVAGALTGTDPPLEMSLVSVDPRSGFVRALVGGRDFNASQVNLALGDCAHAAKSPAGGSACLDGGGSGRQPGSAFKPFTLAKAFEKGMTPESTVSGPASYSHPHCRGNGCTVHNVEERRGFGTISLRQATWHSVNTAFAQLVVKVGVKDTAELAHRVGLTMINPDGKLPDGEPYGPSLTLGAAEVSPLDMASAYGVFAARGMKAPATPVARVIATDGKVLEDNTRRQSHRVLPEPVADNVTDVLRGVLTHGTGTRAAVGRPAAGKTGTGQDYGDAWFVGYTPTLSTAVWMGYTDSRTHPLVNVKGVARVYGGTIPAETWHNYMAQVLQNTPPEDFPAPAPIGP
jgi:penicillin-binding protein 1A